MYRLTAVLTQFQQFQSCKHTVCCIWCFQADWCHRLLTLILLCICTIWHHIMNNALADCSLIFSFFSNCDRSCVYSNNTVYAAVHTFTDVILQDVDLLVLLVPLDSTNSLTGFLTHWFIEFEKRTSFSGHTKSKIQYYYSKFCSLFKEQFSLTHLTGITT